MIPDPPWLRQAPPLDPPTAGGLPADEAEQIAAAWWEDEPHRALALMWESYAGSLEPEPAVASVTTGAQSVVYSGGGGGAFGRAQARAAWHWSRCTNLGSVPLAVASQPPEAVRWLTDDEVELEP